MVLVLLVLVQLLAANEDNSTVSRLERNAAHINIWHLAAVQKII